MGLCYTILLCFSELKRSFQMEHTHTEHLYDVLYVADTK